jgi:Uma2 family endonuclease
MLTVNPHYKSRRFGRNGRRQGGVPDVETDAPPKSKMTEAEFVEWAYAGENIRAEWEAGKVIQMAPVSDAEDDLNNWLSSVLRLFCEQNDLGVVKGPQFMVRFARQKRRRMPDLMFVSKARRHLIQKNHIEGAPDVAFEIVSADSQTRDRRKKFTEYEKQGVREYWIIDPLSRQVEAYVLRRGAYVDIELDAAVLRSSVLPGFYLRPEWLWHRPLPKVLSVLKEFGVR